MAGPAWLSLGRLAARTRMRIFFSLVVFIVSLAVTTIACTWAWEQFVKNHIYNCTDDLPLDYLQPGHWVHHPVAAQHVTSGRSMSEPDTIKQGWSVMGLWVLWSSFVAGSFGVTCACTLAWARAQNGRDYEHTKAT